MNKRSEILMRARGTYERDIYIYRFCKDREKEGTLYGAFALLARQHKTTRERMRQVFRRMEELMKEDKINGKDNT